MFCWGCVVGVDAGVVGVGVGGVGAGGVGVHVGWCWCRLWCCGWC